MTPTLTGRPAPTPDAGRHRTSVFWTAAWGATASTTIAVAATRAGPGPGVVVPDGPLGLWRAADDGQMFWSIVAVVGIALLALAFLRLYGMARRGVADLRSVIAVSTAWAVPLLIGQPLLSLDAYSYLAQGQLVSLGLDPYASGPLLLGPGPVLDAVAPIWRTTPAPYGPLSLSLMGWLADMTGAGHIAFVLLLRLLAVISVVACALAATRLVRPGSQAVAVALIAANPVVILHLVGGVHLDVMIAGFAGVTLLAVRRQWWWLAALAAAVAFSIKLPGLVLVGYVLLARLRGPGARLLGTLGALAIAVGTIIICAAVVPDGWGWLATLDTPGKNHQIYAVPSVLAEFSHRVVAAAGADVHLSEVLTWVRLSCVVSGMVAILVLLLRASHPGDVRRSGALVGGSLMIVAFAAPVIHPWYLSWGLILLAACAGTVARRWLIVASVASCFIAVPHPLVHSPSGITVIVSLLVVAVGITTWWLATHDGESSGPGVPERKGGSWPGVTRGRLVQPSRVT